jgi:hypothetical protein
VWVEGGDIQDELLDQLGGVLAPPEELALTPSAAELEALAAAVAARWPDGTAIPAAGETEDVPGGAPAPPGSPVRPLRSGGRRSLRRLGSGAWRAGSVAAGLVLVSASAAAAANGGVPLPRPVRVVAYTVGLPVDSPALDDTNQHIKDLKEAVKAQDKPKAEASVRRLRTDLTKVPADEKKEAVPKVEAAIAVATTSGLVQSPAPTTTTTLPPSSSTTAPAPAPSITATTAEEKEEKEKEKEKPAATTTTEGTTTTTESEPTTTTTAPETEETPSGEGGTGTGDGGSIGTDPGPTTSTTVPDTTTTTTAPPPDETTTTTTTEPPTTTTTAAPTTEPATVENDSQQG